MGFGDAFHMEFIRKHDIENIMKSNFPMPMPTGSRLLFDFATTSSTAREKRVMINL